MRLFSRLKPEPKPERRSLAVEDLQERMERLERKIRDLEADWAAQYDKFHRLNMRLAKRQKAIEEAETGESPAPENGAGATNAAKVGMNPLAQQLLSRGRY